MVMKMKEKRISVVTPVFNGSEYIERCIISIKNQNYNNFEHIIIDGGSTDGTDIIIQKYLGTYNLKYICQKDNGMYDAIVKGFDLASGEIFAWLNSDDEYMPWAFSVMNYAISQGIHWGMGLKANRNEDDILYQVKDLYYYKQKWLKKQYYGSYLDCVQQESTFWTKELWIKAKGREIASFHLAGDSKLWSKFAEYEPIYSIDTVISSFRHRAGQLSSNYDKYRAEMNLKGIGVFAKLFLLLNSVFYEKKFNMISNRVFLAKTFRIIGEDAAQRIILKACKKFHILVLPQSFKINM